MTLITALCMVNLPCSPSPFALFRKLAMERHLLPTFFHVTKQEVVFPVEKPKDRGAMH